MTPTASLQIHASSNRDNSIRLGEPEFGRIQYLQVSQTIPISKQHQSHSISSRLFIEDVRLD